MRGRQNQERTVGWKVDVAFMSAVSVLEVVFHHGQNVDQEFRWSGSGTQTQRVTWFPGFKGRF